MPCRDDQQNDPVKPSDPHDEAARELLCELCQNGIAMTPALRAWWDTHKARDQERILKFFHERPNRSARLRWFASLGEYERGLITSAPSFETLKTFPDEDAKARWKNRIQPSVYVYATEAEFPGERVMLRIVNSPKDLDGLKPVFDRIEPHSETTPTLKHMLNALLKETKLATRLERA